MIVSSNKELDNSDYEDQLSKKRKYNGEEIKCKSFSKLLHILIMIQWM